VIADQIAGRTVSGKASRICGVDAYFLPCPVRKIFDYDVGHPNPLPHILCNDLPHDMRCTPAAIPRANWND